MGESSSSDTATAFAGGDRGRKYTSGYERGPMKEGELTFGVDDVEITGQ